MEISGDVTDAGRTTTNKRRTREDSATQPMDAGWLSFAITFNSPKISLCNKHGEIHFRIEIKLTLQIR